MYFATQHILFGTRNFSSTARFSANYRPKKELRHASSIHLPHDWSNTHVIPLLLHVKVGNHAHVAINKHWRALWMCVPAHKPFPPPTLLASHVSSPTGHRVVWYRLLVWWNYSNSLRIIAVTVSRLQREEQWVMLTVLYATRTWYESAFSRVLCTVRLHTARIFQ
jgi:hypothetical protein